jgi:ppGpp synthetase/RelA/SpoT-type nucleotidyltranferase
VPAAPSSSVSNSQADRAGAAFRDYMAAAMVQEDGGRRVRPGQRIAGVRAILVIADYRAMHAYPLRKVTMGVRQMIATELAPRAPRPGQRFKRMDRILGKLIRFPRMRLSQMEDIGGCRAVFDSLDDVYAVARRIRRRWPHAKVMDYIASPKDDGYRSLHIVEKRDNRLIEVQLRTARQHEWAEAVEQALDWTGYDIKDGDGPADLRRYYAMAAERLARDDSGEPPDPALERRFVTLREQIRHYSA